MLYSCLLYTSFFWDKVTDYLNARAQVIQDDIDAAAKAKAEGVEYKERYEAQMASAKSCLLYTSQHAKKIVSSELKEAGNDLYFVKHNPNPDHTPNYQQLMENFDAVLQYMENGSIVSASTIKFGGIAEAVCKMGLDVYKRQETVDMGDPGVVYADYDGSGGIDWIASLLQEAQPATLERTYQVTLTNDGEVLERKVVPGKDVLTPAQPAVMKFGGSVSVGSEFFPRTTTYGVDCIGCSGEISGEGGTAAGVKLSNTNGVLQPNGTWKQGIKYGDYYIVAADRSIPMCSVCLLYTSRCV